MTDLPLHLVTDWLNVAVTLGIVGVGMWRTYHMLTKHFFGPIIVSLDLINGKVAEHDRDLIAMQAWLQGKSGEPLGGHSTKKEADAP